MASVSLVTQDTDGRRCPVCSSRSQSFWGTRTGFPLFECGDCKVVFFDRSQISLHDYQTYYEYTDTFDADRISWELRIRRRAISKQLERLATYIKGRELLDVGAGPGYLCKIARDQGWSTSGIEVSAKALRIGREYLSTRYVELAAVPPTSVDLITCHHILEHVEGPKEFIQTLRSKLKPGGVIAVHVPHQEPLTAFIQNKLFTNGEKYCQLYAPEHISGFSKGSLRNTFELFGFETLRVRTSAMWGVYYDPFFLRNFLTQKDYSGVIKQTVRSAVDNVGICVGRGSWVVGHFRKTQSSI